MGKGKGRQSGLFGSKSERAAHASEWQQDQQYYRHQVVRSRPQHQQEGTSSSAQGHPFPAQRPRLTMLGHLKGILRERQYEESLELMDRRRRAGFVPPLASTTFHQQHPEDSTPRLEEHPPGYLLHYGKNRSTKQELSLVESLEHLCLKVLSRYIMEYLEAMGREGLHAALSFLPPETLAELSIAVSKRNGISNDLAYCIGKHAHVEELSFRSIMKTSRDDDGHHSLTDDGLLELVPRLPPPNAQHQYQGDYKEVVDDWEDAYGNELTDDDLGQRQALTLDVLQLDGVNVGLKRLEFVDCLDLSANAVLALLKKCACITHLSLSGSIQGTDDVMEVILALPDLLPLLLVLDVTRCGWVTGNLLAEMRDAYAERYTSRKPPIVLSQGFLPSEDFMVVGEGLGRRCLGSTGW